LFISNISSIPLKDNSIDCCITSPPYWAMRDYGYNEQIGLEQVPEEYISILCDGFNEINRVMKKSGTLWVVIDDTFASNWGHGAKRDSSWWSTKSKEFEGKGWKNVETVMPPNQWKNHPEIKAKDLIGIPHMFAFEMRRRGWYFRSDIIWYKENSRKVKAKDRPQRKHEYILMFSKSQKYYFNDIGLDSVWNIKIKKHEDFHSAQFPEKLVENCILQGCPKKGIVYDPFLGSGTTKFVANKLGYNCIGSDASRKYMKKAKENIDKISVL